jgi:tetratricopeptide (TPR) repeat protein
MTDASRASRDLKAARPDLSPGRVAAVSAALALDRNERPDTVREWLDRLDRADSRRGARTVLALVTVAAVALAAAVWQRQSARPPEAEPPLTAVLPLSVVPAPGLDTTLGRWLAQAIAEQLRWLPDQRVATVSAVEQALRARFGPRATDPDSAAAFVAARFGATRLLTGRVWSAGDRVEVSVRLQTGAGEPLRADSASAPADSLGALVQELVVSVFAEGLARRQVGWSPVLPRGADAVRDYLAARPRLRAGAYAEAVERYEAVIAADSAFAPAHFERTLAEVLRAQPTRVNRALRAALGATRRYQDRLDPATRDLLAAYQTLVADGDLARAHEQLSDLVRRHENAPDAWFILGYLEFHLGPLFGVEPSSARYALERAAALAPEFAAPRAFLGWIALAGDDPEARDHLRAYLAIDSTSASAELVRLVDSIRFRGPRAAIQAAASLDDRPTPALELIALAGASLTLSESERTLAADVIRELRARATTGLDRAIAFRLEMAWLLGGARLESAGRLLEEGRRRNVPIEELDAWTVLLAVTGATRTPPDVGATDAAALRLAAATGDPTAQWLAARWWRGRKPVDARRGHQALSQLARADDGAALLARSLVEDLEALDRLAEGDTAGALERWDRATRRYQIEEVPFGLVASLWPLQRERARLSAARGDHDAVALVAERLRSPVGFMDQVARLDVLPLGIAALQARRDPLRARQLAERLVDLWAGADGAGTALRDSVRALVPGV